MNFNFEHNKNKYRILTIFITIIFILSTILPVSVNAINNEKVVPEIKVTYKGIEPSNPKVSQDFKVRYRVDPQGFYYEDSKPKEIVLVLDTSSSINKEINQWCEDYNYYWCYSCKKYIDNTPEEHRNERPNSNHSISSVKYCKEHNTARRHYTTKIYELKKAAKNFLDSLTSISTDGQTPKMKNLKIGIVTYTNKGYINKDLVEVTDSNSIKDNNIKELKNTIDNLTADYGRNIGDGLRKGVYMLNKSDDTNKTMIFMSSGEPINFSMDNKWIDYYTVLDDDNDKYYAVNYPNSNCLEYAKIIGGIINEKKYNVFSIGYGLGDENSSSNQKMKEIHESMGGTENTFFPTAEGDIDKVFQQITDNMIKVSFDDVKLNLNFDDNITMVSGFESTNGNNGVIKINPIVYTKDKNNQYTATPAYQEIEFTVKAKKEGELKLLKEGSNLSYTDINGNLKEIAIDSPTVKIEPYEQTDKGIRILEVEPADSFKLNINGNNKTGIDTTQRNGYEIIVEHMSMPEFIGNKNELNGKYDVIVIGRYVDNSIKNNGYQFNDYSGLENDITELKSKEIKDFINSGQLVYLDVYLYNTNARKLNKLLWEYQNQTTDNLIEDMSVNDYYNKYYNNEITLDKIIDKYIERITQNSSLKRPKLSVQEKPIGDSKDDELGSIDKRNMKFKINLNDVKDEEVTIKLYLDINGDGLFKEEEAVKIMDKVKIIDGSYSFEYKFYNDYPEFIGYLDWRIEVSKPNVLGFNNPIISYADGNVLFRRVKKEKRKINVLQVAPYGRNDLKDNQRKNLNLAENVEFKNLLKELKDYDIKVDVISYEDFYQGSFKGPGRDSLKKSDYDIVIAGFSDCYSDKMNQRALDEIKDYIKVGQGLMLTHDTLWYKLEDIRSSDKFIKQFRDCIGQSRYRDEEFNINEYDIDGVNKIPHDKDKPYGNSKEAIGSTLWARKSDTDVNNSNSTEVYRVNKSLITNYPFELGETIRVRRTHGQYLQLNLEDENVIPWFTLTDNNKNNNDGNTPYGGTNSVHVANKYDPRNNFYTYSKGNITFSGTGENSREDCQYPRSELKLFVNTIVKAERGANHKPTITALENINEIPGNKDLNFKAIVKDIDGDKVKINSIKVKLEKDDDDKYENISNYNSLPSKLKSQGSSFDLKIPSRYFNDRINKDVSIEIVAEDEKGAQRIKEYTVVPTLEALLVAEDKKVQVLTGDQIDFKIPLERKNDNSSDKITDVELKDIEYNSQNVQYDSKDIKVEKENNEYYLVGKLIPLRQLAGEKINIILGYKSNGDPKECNVKVVVDSKDGEVKLILQDSRGNPLNTDAEVTLSNKDGFNSKVTVQKDLESRYTWPKDLNDEKVKSGEYNISLDKYSEEQYKVSTDRTNTEEQNKGSFKMDFDNPKIEMTIKININYTEIVHGIYKGSQNNNSISINSIDTNTLKNTFAKESIVPIGAYISDYQPGNNININIKDGSIIGDVKVYILGSDGVKESKTMNKQNDNNYTFAFNDGSQTVCNIFILYNQRLPNKEGKYQNELKVDNCPESRIILRVGEIELPELF
ncbi:DUF5057 domain-containing protein [Clostridium weizhouense]|uniref:DUF5057 domain-containing protein n=1 Tax=Clostridium weizhouense TaxID=2859781 RepID=A0ABS7ANG3_9CLOT|nr:DUF5057 domain-containing protein [Clostridium weizhouense]MBW6410210.1 DUF5057 domain-containing protein [Clostridium weizhouense]